MSNKRQRIFSGIRPTGDIHIGNYLGSINQWVELQNQGHDCIFAIVDYHALTTHQEALSRNSINLAKWVIASGVNPQKTPIILQSQIPEHTELAWIFSCLTPLGELYRMTQFKEKSEGEKKISIKTGLLTYPLLMAADILLYQTDVVPVGEDQTQHVELARDIAKRFNHYFGKTFIVPKIRLAQAPRIMSLKNPNKKMSKTSADGIALSDNPEQIRRKIKSATTDNHDDSAMSPGVKNLFSLLHAFDVKNANKFEEEFANRTIQYANLKNGLSEAIIRTFQPIQDHYREISDQDIEKVFQNSRKKISYLAVKTLEKVKKSVGMFHNI